MTLRAAATWIAAGWLLVAGSACGEDDQGDGAGGCPQVDPGILDNFELSTCTPTDHNPGAACNPGFHCCTWPPQGPSMSGSAAAGDNSCFGAWTYETTEATPRNITAVIKCVGLGSETAECFCIVG